ncbi:hypothetical protein SAMN02745945_00635 [Peptoclostridium litorale DSM 5388]|uniref:Uncharacterized protein n=1 Tax=Peptoclostridium litorale DSM 5388 TaxID=1121324 RepID=A0A069RD65_PEPLI|nr:hypothetical protein CLIT_11c00260 [Peptoclostridium litorale DSM 5388]SIN76790.1 hypothetical protein SAMN02745945_00635 [Peptoclostridium litorale DSM 5388]
MEILMNWKGVMESRIAHSRHEIELIGIRNCKGDISSLAVFV